MTELIPHEFRGTKVRVVAINGDPWFVAADVCFVLGYRNGRDAVAKHVREGQKGVSRIATPSGEQSMTVISEGGLYRLLMRANTVLADEFQDWVTDEVLPSIRKSGSYVAQITPRQLAELVIAEADRADRAEAKVAELAPMAAEAEHHRASAGLKAVGDFANDLKAWAKEHHPDVKVRHQDVWNHLGRLGLVIRGDTIRHNQPTAKAIESGYCVPKVSDFDTPEGQRSTTTTRLTPKGEGYVWDRLTAFIEANGALELPRQIGGVA